LTVKKSMHRLHLEDTGGSAHEHHLVDLGREGGRERGREGCVCR